MCEHCEENMTIIAERTSIPRSIVAEVYAAQKALIVEEETREYEAAVEAAGDIAAKIESGEIDIEALAVEQAIERTNIPGFIMEALVAGIGGPVVVLGAAPHGGGGEAMLTIQCAGTGGPALAARMCSSAAETLSSDLIETGGVTADGALVSPIRRRSTRDEE